MSEPSPPPVAVHIVAKVHEAVGGIQLDPVEKREVWRIIGSELPYLWSQRSSYCILGRHRDPYIRRLRAAQNQLTKQFGAYPFIVADLVEFPTERLDAHDIAFTLLATYTDDIVGVFVKERGGEAPELGEIDDPPYFAKSYVFPRDYSWIPTENAHPMDDESEEATYSWVHLNKFRKFELHDRCFPWTTVEELRTAVGELPSPTPRPHWEDDE